MAAALPFLPAAVGVVGSLLGSGKGKDKTYQAMQDPSTNAAYQQLLKIMQQRMGQQSAGYQPTMDAMNLIYRQFFGNPYMQNRGMQTPATPPNAATQVQPRYPVRPV